MRARGRRLLLMSWVFAVLLVAPWALPGLARADEADAQVTAGEETATLEINSVEELAGKRLVMVSGGGFDTIICNSLEGFSLKDFSYYNSNAEMIQAVKQGKADAMICDMPVAQLAVSKNTGVGIMPEILVQDHYGYVLKKGSPLTSMINERIAAYRADGTLDALVEKWTGPDDSLKTMPAHDWDGPRGTIVVACASDTEPIAYQVGKDAYGLSVELLCLAARDLGYDLDLKCLAVNALISEVQSGKADIAATCFSITDERKQVVDMTDSYYDGGVVAVVKADTGDAAAQEGFLERLGGSFQRTFIVENRWQLILSGLGVTLAVSVASGALGLGLGYLFVLARRKKEGGAADKAIHVLEKLLGGLPVVVVLMVFYYVVFGSLDIPGIIVAILVFTLMFGTSSGSIMWNAICAIDGGQTEAGRALGFSDRDTFHLVVLPQAARQFAPLLLSQFVTLVKDTSVVGYIAVQDLTRVGDLIRARTMEAFFPLIATAVIYFAVCWSFAWLLDRVRARMLDPKTEPRTIQGVDLT